MPGKINATIQDFVSKMLDGGVTIQGTVDGDVILQKRKMIAGRVYLCGLGYPSKTPIWEAYKNFVVISDGYFAICEKHETAK